MQASEPPAIRFQDSRRLDRRRFLSTVGASAGGVAALAACGISPANPRTEKTGMAEPVRVRTLTRTSYDEPAWSTFNETSEGVRVDPEKGPDTTTGYGAKILASVAAGSAPDIIYTHPNFFSSLASLKVLTDVEKLATRDKFDLKGIQKELLDSDRWDGVLYALPYSGVANLVVFNAGLFQRRGLATPAEQARSNTWTWESFRDSVRKLTVREPGLPPEVGMPEHFRGLQYMSQWVFGAGGQVWSKDLKRCLLDSKEATGALDFLAQLHHKDRVSIQADEAAEFGGMTQEGFPTGRVALRFRATTELHFYRQMAEEGAKLGVAPVPKGPAGTTPRGAANSWGIWSQSTAPDAAWKAIAAWHADPVLRYVYSNRNCFPCRQTQFEHPSFKVSLFPWEDLEVEKVALRDVRIMATPARFTEIDDGIWLKLWPQAREGQRSVKDILADFLPQANSLLAG